MATANRIVGNYVGSNAAGTAPLGNKLGIGLARGARQNIIGSATAPNLVSGNLIGIQLQDSGTMSNTIAGNRIGTDQAGLAPLGNETGIFLWINAHHNRIGTPATGNLLSGNSVVGLALQDGAAHNQIQGNKIGTDLTGLGRLPNMWGILVQDGGRLEGPPTHNLIGGPANGEGNLISGNREAGIQLQDQGASHNTILGNIIGLDINGTGPISNTMGVVIGFGADGNTVGGQIPGAGNLIGGNREVGVNLQNAGTANNQIFGNTINGTGGQLVGVGLVDGARNNIIGGDPLSGPAANHISGQSMAGLHLHGSNTRSNVVQGNTISANLRYGVHLEGGAAANTIGISNTITNNGSRGVAISGNTLQNTISRNWIYGNGGLPIDYLNIPEPIALIEIFHTPAPFVVSGTICSGCVAEIYGNPTPALNGTCYLGRTTADDQGHFSFTTAPPAPGCANPALTATDKQGTTSEFYSHIFGPQLSNLVIYLPQAIKNRP
jgi:hypothetical protein